VLPHIHAWASGPPDPRKSTPVAGRPGPMAAALAAHSMAHSMAQLRYYPAVSAGRSVNRTESPIQKLLQSWERSGNGYPFGPARAARKVAGRAGGPYPKSRNSIQKAQCTKRSKFFSRTRSSARAPIRAALTASPIGPKEHKAKKHPTVRSRGRAARATCSRSAFPSPPLPDVRAL
jgi:hypothetical protein